MIIIVRMMVVRRTHPTLAQTFIGDFKMATSSFYKSFVIKDKKAAQKFRKALLTQHLIKVEEKDLPKEFKGSFGVAAFAPIRLFP